jgi:hypothetical protein
MATETFKKRQKEAARREKQLKKFARRSERKIEKAKAETSAAGENSQATDFASKNGPTIL